MDTVDFPTVSGRVRGDGDRVRTVRVATLNVSGAMAVDGDRLGRLLSLLDELDADLYGLSEVGLAADPAAVQRRVAVHGYGMVASSLLAAAEDEAGERREPLSAAQAAHRGVALLWRRQGHLGGGAASEVVVDNDGRSLSAVVGGIHATVVYQPAGLEGMPATHPERANAATRLQQALARHQTVAAPGADGEAHLHGRGSDGRPRASGACCRVVMGDFNEASDTDRWMEDDDGGRDVHRRPRAPGHGAGAAGVGGLVRNLLGQSMLLARLPPDQWTYREIVRTSRSPEPGATDGQGADRPRRRRPVTTWTCSRIDAVYYSGAAEVAPASTPTGGPNSGAASLGAHRPVLVTLGVPAGGAPGRRAQARGRRLPHSSTEDRRASKPADGEEPRRRSYEARTQEFEARLAFKRKILGAPLAAAAWEPDELGSVDPDTIDHELATLTKTVMEAAEENLVDSRAAAKVARAADEVAATAGAIAEATRTLLCIDPIELRHQHDDADGTKTYKTAGGCLRTLVQAYQAATTGRRGRQTRRPGPPGGQQAALPVRRTVALPARPSQEAQRQPGAFEQGRRYMRVWQASTLPVPEHLLHRVLNLLRDGLAGAKAWYDTYTGADGTPVAEYLAMEPADAEVRLADAAEELEVAADRWAPSNSATGTRPPRPHHATEQTHANAEEPADTGTAPHESRYKETARAEHSRRVTAAAERLARTARLFPVHGRPVKNAAKDAEKTRPNSRWTDGTLLPTDDGGTKLETNPDTITSAITELLRGKFSAEPAPELAARLATGAFGFERAARADETARACANPGPAPNEPPLLAPITPQEVRGALSGKPGRAGGISGVTNDLLRVIADETVQPPDLEDDEEASRAWMGGVGSFFQGVSNLLSAMLLAGHVPQQACLHVIVPLKKRRNTPRLQSNVRPIALGDAVVKLLFAVLAARLVRALDDSSVLHPGQKAFVLNGGVQKCVTLSRVFAAEARQRGDTVYGVYADVAQAYDSVRYELLEAAMRRVGLPERFVSFVVQFHRQARACVRLGGVLGEEFAIQRSVAQGNPLAPVLFVLVVDPMLVHVDDVMAQPVPAAPEAEPDAQWWPARGSTEPDPDFRPTVRPISGVPLQGDTRILAALHESPWRHGVTGNCRQATPRLAQLYADDASEISTSPDTVARALQATSAWTAGVGMALATRAGKNVAFSSAPDETLCGLGLCVKILDTGAWSVRVGRLSVDAEAAPGARTRAGYRTLWIPFQADKSKIRYLGIHSAGASANEHEVARLHRAVCLGVSSAYAQVGPMSALDEITRSVHSLFHFAAPHVSVPARFLGLWDSMMTKLLHWQMGGLRHVAGRIWEAVVGYEPLSELYHRVRASSYVTALRGESDASVALRRLAENGAPSSFVRKAIEGDRGPLKRVGLRLERRRPARGSRAASSPPARAASLSRRSSSGGTTQSVPVEQRKRVTLDDADGTCWYMFPNVHEAGQAGRARDQPPVAGRQLLDARLAARPDIVVYTDGSVLDNGECGAAAVVAPHTQSTVDELRRYESEDACSTVCADLGLATAAAPLANFARPDNNLAEGVAAVLAAAAPDPQQGGFDLELRSDSKVLIDSYTRWRHERNERWRLNHPLAVVLRALDTLCARRDVVLALRHVRAHWHAADHVDKALNAAADAVAKAAAARLPPWASAPAVDMRVFDPHYSVLTNDDHPLGGGLHVAAPVGAFIKAQRRLQAEADLAADSPSGSGQSALARELGVARLRAAVRGARSAGLSRAGQIMAVRIVSGTLPTFQAAWLWYRPGCSDSDSQRAASANANAAVAPAAAAAAADDDDGDDVSSDAEYETECSAVYESDKTDTSASSSAGSRTEVEDEHACDSRYAADPVERGGRSYSPTTSAAVRRFFGELPPLAQGGATDASGSEPETSTTEYEDSSSASSSCSSGELSPSSSCTSEERPGLAQRPVRVRRQPLADKFRTLARTKDRLYGHLSAVVLDEANLATTLCPLCAASDHEAEDTQRHWADQCEAMEETWRRLWVTNVALTVYGAFGGVGGVSESACWRLARELWPALANAQDTEPNDSDGADTDGAQAEPDGRPAGSWTDRCGFFGAKQIEEALADKQITRAVFKGVKPKALIRVLRKSMIETAAEVWQKRLESLRSLP